MVVTRLLMTSPAIAAMFYVSFSVATHTPGHLHRCNAGNTIHGLHGTVTFLTLDALLNVPFMRKVNKIGHVVNLDPGNGLTLLPIGCQLKNFRLFADVS